MTATNTLRRFVLVTSLVTGTPGIALAQDAGASFDSISARIRPGARLIVTTESGERITGSLVNVSATSLVMTSGRDRREIAPATTRTIVHRDPTVWSVLLGAAGGFAAGWAVAASECRLLTLPEIFDDCSDSGSFTAAKTAVFVLPVAGAAIGWALDASRNATIFQRGSPTTVALAPAVARRAASIRVTLRF